ncbi:MAG TPA: prolyl oligopeptidase family serine peptidase [Propionibacteriaceae bacterium]|nr:prolyl oligopeptidase family serine peptidase [Propionibacteriaceae bacterium]
MPVPRPDRRPRETTLHGRTVVDPYAWLDDLEDPAVVAHLEAETAYADEQTQHLRPLRERIVAEISSRTLQTDLSVPDHDIDARGRAWWYFARTVEGQDYPSYRRAPAPSRDDVPDIERPIEGEALLLDLQAEAAGHDVFAVGDVDVSPSGDLLVWSCDTAGDELYEVHFRDLTSGEDLRDVLQDVASVCWIDDRHVAYTVPDDSWRPYLLRRHALGTDVGDDVDLLREDDERFWVSAARSGDDRWLVVDTASKASSEVHLLDVTAPTSSPVLVVPRREGVEYSVEPAGDELFVVHNARHRDFELAVTAARPHAWADWETVLPGEDGVRLLDVTAYADHLVVHLRKDGLPRVLVVDRPARTTRLVEASAELESVGAADQHYLADRLRLHRESYVDPATVLEVSWEGTGERILKRQAVLPDPEGRPFRTEDYVQRRLWALAADGVEVPVSVVSHRDTAWPAPCVLYGYGAYETSLDPGFSVARLSLLDRGVVVAYAHVRGGGELGRTWYEQGRLAAKATTFSDFVAVGRHLVDAGVALPGRLAARGASAGGLTVGAALNLAPELFCAAQVGVGFLDPLTAMLAEDLPLTVTERDEWGDPVADPEAFARIASYSPYGNIGPGPYPDVLATAALHDQRVSASEPAKWVAALRDREDASGQVLLRVEMGGHQGATGRYQAWRDEAYELAWLLDRLGLGGTA